MQLDTVELPDNVLWRDEYDWDPVAQATERTIPGSLIIYEDARDGGRPVTLAGMWVSRTTVDALESLRAQVATNMTLTLPGGQQLTVAWRRGERAIEARPLHDAAPDVLATEDATYALTLRLMEVAP